MVRTGVEIYRGMSVQLRTGVEKYDICYWQCAWESRMSGSGSAGAHGSREIDRYVCSAARGSD